MAMTKCKECGKEISTKATQCPNCGAKIKKTGFVTKAILALIVIGVIGSIYGSITASNEHERQQAAETARRASLTPAQRAQEDASRRAAAAKQAKDKQQENERFQRTLLVAKTIKENLNDPASFELVQALANDDGSLVCIIYRGKNGFGAIVKEAAVYSKGKLSGNLRQVEIKCAHKTLFDESSIKFAL